MQAKVVHLISSLKIGGAESWLVDLLENLPKSLEHQIIFFYDGPNRKILEDKGYKTYHLAPQFHNPLFLYRLYRLLKTINPDFIHSSLWSANFFGRICAFLLGIPIISSLHLGIDEEGKVRNFLDRFTFGLAHHYIAVSEVVETTVKARHHWLKRASFSTIKNGISLPDSQNTMSRASLGIPESAFVFGCVGRFIPRKNFAWFIECFQVIHAQNPSSHLLILGLGPEEEKLKALVQEYNLASSITFIIGKKALPYYALMDCFVQPSKQEGLSIALLEAMSYGLPCIATSITKTHDALVHTKNGLIVSLEKNEMIAACLTVLNNNILRIKLGQEAYNSIEQDYSCKKMAARYVDIYKSLIVQQDTVE